MTASLRHAIARLEAGLDPYEEYSPEDVDTLLAAYKEAEATLLKVRWILQAAQHSLGTSRLQTGFGMALAAIDKWGATQ